MFCHSTRLWSSVVLGTYSVPGLFEALKNFLQGSAWDRSIGSSSSSNDLNMTFVMEATKMMALMAEFALNIICISWTSLMQSLFDHLHRFKGTHICTPFHFAKFQQDSVNTLSHQFYLHPVFTTNFNMLDSKVENSCLLLLGFV